MTSIHSDCLWIMTMLAVMVCLLVADKVWWRRKP